MRDADGVDWPSLFARFGLPDNIDYDYPSVAEYPSFDVAATTRMYERSNMDRREILKKAIERNEAELARYANFPDVDPFADGTIVRYEQVFAPGGKVYSYAALRADGMWYITGRKGEALRWDLFVEILSSTKTINIRVVRDTVSWTDGVRLATGGVITDTDGKEPF